MQKTVREIIQMIDDKKLKFDQTTQREFIYSTMDAGIPIDEGTLTKSGSVIRSILYLGIQLPAVYFWKTGHDVYNIHDGKQRILSIYYFCKPEIGTNIVTRLGGKEIGWNGLTESQQQKLLNYKIDIVVNEGTKEEEEESFYIINKTGVNLTDYECLKGMFYGTWLTEFEKYITLKSKSTDCVNQIGRGEQALLWLYACFNLNEDKQANKIIRDKLRDSIRDNHFDPSIYNLDKIIETVSILRNKSGIKDKVAIPVAHFIVKHNFNIKKISKYYESILSQINDVNKWEIATHKSAIKALIYNNIKCDGKRFFTTIDKDELYKTWQTCLVCEKVNEYSKLEVDHIKPWSKGGKSNIDNGRLLCKSCNASKGNDYNEEDEL